MALSDLITLQAGDFRLTLDPQTGGAIAALTFRGKELLRPVADARLAAQHGRAVAAYPLIPYANRIAWGRFRFGGEKFQLTRNFGDHPHTIHGNAWMNPWSVAEAGEQSAILTFDSAPCADWPFAYRAEQAFSLHPTRLDLALSVLNTDRRPWPAGIGLHPYVSRTPETTLRFVADTAWTTGADSLPDAREAVAGRFAFDQGRAIGASEIDACYAGWGGTAQIAMPEDGLVLTLSAAPPMDHFQVYTPAGQTYMGLEPVTNMPDAINRMEIVADQGLVVLGAGEVLRVGVIIEVKEDVLF
jgi:aldose 1-epimerase